MANAAWKALSKGKSHTLKLLALFHKAYTPGWGEERGEAIDKLQVIVRQVAVDEAGFAQATHRYRRVYVETAERLHLSLEERTGSLERASIELADSAKKDFVAAIAAYKKGVALLSSPLTVFAQAVLSDSRGS